jgi:hypothetical protein
MDADWIMRLEAARLASEMTAREQHRVDYLVSWAFYYEAMLAILKGEKSAAVALEVETQDTAEPFPMPPKPFLTVKGGAAR